MPEDSANAVTVSSDSNLENANAPLADESTEELSDAADETKRDNSLNEIKKLDALDELPENKKRARIILFVIGILALFSVVVIIVMPPLGWSPQKGVRFDYAPVASIQSVEVGGERNIELVYQNIDSEIVYDAEIEQDTYYSEGAVSKFRFKAGLNVSKPARRNHQDEIAMKLQDVDVHIFDNDVEVNLASAGELLEGIYMFSRLEAHRGMYSIVPDANINPQVARMLFTITDAVRQIWAPLPEEKIGVNTKWHFVDNVEADGGVGRSVDASIVSCSDAGCSIASSIRLEKFEQNREAAAVGDGSATVLIKDGRVVKAEFLFKRTHNVLDNAAQKQETKLRFALRK